MENLPGEVLSEIFVRLLAKQIGQMRCVSKTWNALLSDSSFVKSHLHRSINNNDEILLFFSLGLYFNSSPITARPSRSPDVELTNLVKPPVILRPRISFDRVIGSANGLICFEYGSCHNDYDLHIWNPSLSALLTLPPSSSPSKILFAIGFGFYPIADDYKVVKVTSFSRGATNMVLQTEVYSMRKGLWESTSQSFPSHITRLEWDSHVCVDGHLHWLFVTDFQWEQETILTFDLGAETLREIPLPDSLQHNRGRRADYVGVLSGKLCLMSRVFGHGGKCEVWVMDEYGVVESWVKHHAFSQFSGDIFPYGFTSRGEFLFKVDAKTDRLALYDPVASTTKMFKTFLWPTYISIVVEYVDSLVWIQPANRLQI